MKITKEYYCDTCGEVINANNHGAIEWHQDSSQDKIIASGFRICHTNASCYKHSRNTFDLHHLDAQKILVFVCTFLNKDKYREVNDVEELIEVFQRIVIPSYEEARKYIDVADEEGLLEGISSGDRLSTPFLESLIKKYS